MLRLLPQSRLSKEENLAIIYVLEKQEKEREQLKIKLKLYRTEIYRIVKLALSKGLHTNLYIILKAFSDLYLLEDKK
jgi:hypothetical protein